MASILGKSHLGCDVCGHHGEEEMLLVLPLALQQDPGLQAPPGAGPVLPPLSLVEPGPEPALAQRANQAEKLPAHLK